MAGDRCNQAHRGGISCIFRVVEHGRGSPLIQSLNNEEKKLSVTTRIHPRQPLSRSCAQLWDLLVNATHTRSKPGQLTAALWTLLRSFCRRLLVPPGTSAYRTRARRPLARNTSLASSEPQTALGQRLFVLLPPVGPPFSYIPIAVTSLAPVCSLFLKVAVARTHTRHPGLVAVRQYRVRSRACDPAQEEQLDTASPVL